MGLINAIFGTYSDRQLKKLEKTVNRIEAMADEYRAKSDEELKAMTPALKARLANGETLDDILPEAFATVREAADRVLGKRPFRVQLIGGIVLHQGRIAEMKTGEGKTLVATMPAYLNALAGEGVHIVTVNDYLARVGSEEMGRIYAFLGMTTGLILHDQTREEKQAAYNADITYGTNNEYGFDYLRDNRVIYKEQMVQRGHAFAIIDEVDSILIDEARTPLIISGVGEKSTPYYDLADKFVRTLRKLVVKEADKKEATDEVEEDYIVDEKARTATLTENGVAKAEAYFHVDNLSDPENADLLHYIHQAIHAHGVMKCDVDYLVKDNQVLIVDSFTGRIMYGRRYSDGLHQALEAKEHVKIEDENQTLATITFQNFFRLYKKLSGMTGTAQTEEDEFREIYNLDVVVIPTNMPMIRVDHNDRVYRTMAGKYRAIVEQVRECHEKGQPVLVGTIAIEKSELLSGLLKRAGIPHTVLNAKYHEREAEIVAQAGKLGAVTISTNMAGRGTDIMLGGNPEWLAKAEMRRLGYEEEVIIDATGTSVSVSEEAMAARKVFRELYDRYKAEIAPEAKKICEAGGLYIIGTERHESRRIDNQLRGRSGRQGDPGESCFFLSMEDDLMRLFGSERISAVVANLGMDEDTPIDARILSGSIESAQKRLEGQNFNRRKNVLTYDDVMNQQRTIIYSQRREVLDGLDLREKVLGMVRDYVRSEILSETTAESPAEWNFDGLRNGFAGILATADDFRYTDEELASLDREALISEWIERAEARYAEKEAMFPSEQMREIERVILLRCVDTEWIEHLENMDSLEESIGLHAYAQRNPITEYRIAGADLFDAMVDAIRIDTVRAILSVMPRKDGQQIKRVQVAKEVSEGFAGGEPEKKAPVRKKASEKVGRNDPCPCGSGRKYKKCCGKNEGAGGEDD